MPTTKTRINISLPSEIEEILSLLAKRDEVPVATKALELLKEALELEEDKLDSAIFEARMKNVKKWYSHQEVWNKFLK